MKVMDPELIRRELIDSFEFILELDKSPGMLERLPKKSVMFKQGKKKNVRIH